MKVQRCLLLTNIISTLLPWRVHGEEELGLPPKRLQKQCENRWYIVDMMVANPQRSKHIIYSFY